MTIYVDGFTTPLISVLIGFANGSVEYTNPLIADMYSNRTTMLNKFHVWFPGGIVIGALATTKEIIWVGWQLKRHNDFANLVHGYVLTLFPKSENIDTDTSNNIKSLLPIIIFVAICMTLTATIEPEYNNGYN